MLELIIKLNKKELVKARSTFIYLAAKSGWTTDEACKLVGRNRTLASYYIKKYDEVLQEGEPWYDKILANEICAIKLAVNNL